MAKLSYADKMDIYKKRKQGKTLSTLMQEYKIQQSNIEYLTRLIDKHGFDILKKSKNRYYEPHKKEEIINRVLISNESILSVAIDEGLSSVGMLINWINKYKENGYNIVERKRGRSPTMNKKPKQKNETETIEEENERLKQENLYLKAELEYSKKLRAVVQARKNRQQKKK